jgi:hypothetical protein
MYGSDKMKLFTVYNLVHIAIKKKKNKRTTTAEQQQQNPPNNQILRNSQGLEQTFLQEDITSKQTRRCLTSLIVIRKVQIKTIIQYYLISVRMVTVSTTIYDSVGIYSKNLKTKLRKDICELKCSLQHYPQ